MQILVLNSCPVGLRGDISRWFMELAPGVYVGKVSARVRDKLWDRIVESIGRGRALMIYPDRTEQGYTVREHKYGWGMENFDGVILMRRPPEGHSSQSRTVPVDIPPECWSTAARRRRFRKR